MKVKFHFFKLIACYLLLVVFYQLLSNLSENGLVDLFRFDLKNVLFFAFVSPLLFLNAYDLEVCDQTLVLKGAFTQNEIGRYEVSDLKILKDISIPLFGLYLDVSLDNRRLRLNTLKYSKRELEDLLLRIR